jgi:hypothetical protein
MSTEEDKPRVNLSFPDNPAFQGRWKARLILTDDELTMLKDIVREGHLKIMPHLSTSIYTQGQLDSVGSLIAKINITYTKLPDPCPDCADSGFVLMDDGEETRCPHPMHKTEGY